MARGKVVTASNVSINKVTAYNVKTKTKGDPMKVTSVVKYAITKDGEPTGKFRYQLKGKSKSSDGTGMSRMVGANDAIEYADQLGTIIEERMPKAKTAKRPRKTCKELAVGYEARCDAKRAPKAAAAEEEEYDSEEEDARPLTQRKKVKKAAAPKKKAAVKKSPAAPKKKAAAPKKKAATKKKTTKK